MKRLEPVLYAAVLAALGVLLLLEGRRASELASKRALAPKQLYAQLSNARVQLQVVDLRGYDDDHYLDTHIPGAIPLPDCDPARAPEAARERAYPWVPTVLVTDTGTSPALERCRVRFSRHQVLAGGMDGWSDARLPEDTGEYVAPKSAGGGGCL